MPQKQIVTMGGGGWGMEPENPLLDRYIYNLVKEKSDPRICFVPTASGDSEQYIARFYRHFVPKPARLSHLSLSFFQKKTLTFSDGMMRAVNILGKPQDYALRILGWVDALQIYLNNRKMLRWNNYADLSTDSTRLRLND